MKGVWAAVAALALAGCHRPPPPSPQPQADAGTPAPTAVGVQAPLPLEWSLSPAADGSLRAGPRGRGVLRIDFAPRGTPRPSPQELARGFEAGLKGISATVMRTEEDPTFSGVVLAVSHAQGGTLSSHPVFLGAKQAGDAVYLCASTPGSTLTELSRAAAVCRDLAPRHR